MLVREYWGCGVKAFLVLGLLEVFHIRWGIVSFVEGL